MKPAIARSPARRADRRDSGDAGERPCVSVMIVDDSLTVRTIFKRMVGSDTAMRVAGTASSAEGAISQLEKKRPDVLLLDLDMPGMGGLEALPHILKAAPETQVLVVSALTQEGAEATVTALSTGAVDTMLKPRPGEFGEAYRRQLLDKIRAIGTAPCIPEETPQTGNPPQTALAPKNQRRTPARTALRRAPAPQIVAIGASTGGIHALNILLRSLSPEFDLPILITQHLPASFIPVFARQLEMASGRPTSIAEAGTVIRPGGIFVATGEGHMVLRRAGEELVAEVSSTPASSGCLPSVDPMLESLVETCEGRALAIILSGMGRDGVDGARRLHDAGGTIWAQDAETSAVWGMPGAVSRAGITSLVTAPAQLGTRLAAHCSHAVGSSRAMAASAQGPA